MRFLISILFINLSWQLTCQIHFYKLFSGNGYDRAEGITQLTDSSYLITGSSSSWSENSDVFLLHLDSLGNYLWSKNYGGFESDGGKRIMHNNDLGVFISGHSNSFNAAGDYDALLLKTDFDGNEQWRKTYGNSGFWEKINDATMTLDSGVILVGESLNMVNDNSNIYVIRTNGNGDTLWTKTIGGAGKDIANSIIKVNNNYLIGGQFFVADSNMTKGFVMEINDNGDVLRFDTISDLSGNYYVSDLSLGVNKYYVIGYRETIGDNDDYYGIFDLNGGLISQYTFVYPGYNTQLNQLAYISALDRVAIGYQSLNPGTNQDAYDVSMAYFFAQDLNYIAPFWSMAISNFGEDKLNDLIETSDGSFIAVGFNSIVDDGIIQPNGGSNLFVAKIGPDNVFPNAFGAQLNPLVGNSELLENQPISIYPNPFFDKLMIQAPNSQNQTISIFNQVGQCIFKQTVSVPSVLDVSSILEGIYFIKVGQKSFKLIKQ